MRPLPAPAEAADVPAPHIETVAGPEESGASIPQTVDESAEALPLPPLEPLPAPAEATKVPAPHIETAAGMEEGNPLATQFRI